MVISNIMNLAGIAPKEIYKWFMEMYIDSSDWVMVPNVFGMAHMPMVVLCQQSLTRVDRIIF